MTIHAISYYSEYDQENGAHKLREVEYTCSYRCMMETLEVLRDLEQVPAIDNDSKGLLVWYSTKPFPPHVVEYGAWPGVVETNYDVYCANCGVKLWKGLESE